jgi:hypothetical protein
MYICSCGGELLPAFLIPLKTCKIKGNHERMREGPPPRNVKKRRGTSTAKSEGAEPGLIYAIGV